MMDKKRIAQLLEALGKGLFEKEHVLSLSLLAAVAGESIFLLNNVLFICILFCSISYLINESIKK